MTHRVLFHPEARRELNEIHDYIFDQGAEIAAARFATDIVSYCLGFSTFPERGMQRPDLGDGVRVVGFRRRVSIAFFVSLSDVLILGIFYGGREIAVPGRLSWTAEDGPEG